MHYVEIAVNVPQVSGVFHYHVPSDLEGRLQPGQLVTVPFGALTVQGVILRPVETPSVSQTKAVGELLDEQAVLTPAQLAFAAALAEQNMSPLAAAIGLMLPPGLDQQADTEYTSLVRGSLDLPGQKLTGRSASGAW